MKVCYIAHPIRGEIEANIIQVHRYMRWALDEGLIPVAPYLPLLRILDEASEDDRAKGFECNIQLIQDCDLLWVCGERISPGMLLEIKAATLAGVQIVQAGPLPEIYHERALITYV